MKFQKGMPKPPNSGRKKGSKNKLKRVADFLAEQGIDPLKEILNLMDVRGEKSLSNGMKLDAWFQILSYCHAKPKEMEVEQSDEDELLDATAETPTEALLKVVRDDGVS